MISKERLQELIEQGATIYEVKYGKINPVSLKNKIRFISKKYPVIVFEPRPNEKYNHHKYFDKLFENLEEAEWHKEFGCIERTENLKLLPYEEICDGYDFVFSTPNHCRVTMFIGGNEIFMYKGISSCWSWELTRENYTIACKKCKELFLGENNDKENS